MKGVFVRRTFGLLLAVSAVAGVASEAVARRRFDGLLERVDRDLSRQRECQFDRVGEPARVGTALRLEDARGTTTLAASGHSLRVQYIPRHFQLQLFHRQYHPRLGHCGYPLSEAFFGRTRLFSMESFTTCRKWIASVRQIRSTSCCKANLL